MGARGPGDCQRFSLLILVGISAAQYKAITMSKLLLTYILLIIKLDFWMFSTKVFAPFTIWITNHNPGIQCRTTPVQLISYPLLSKHSRLDSSNIGSCSLTFYFSPSFVASISIVCNPFTGSLTAGHSITPSLAASSTTNRCVPAKLCLNKWMCFLPPGQTSFFCWTRQKHLTVCHFRALLYISHLWR